MSRDTNGCGEVLVWVCSSKRRLLLEVEAVVGVVAVVDCERTIECVISPSSTIRVIALREPDRPGLLRDKDLTSPRGRGWLQKTKQHNPLGSLHGECTYSSSRRSPLAAIPSTASDLQTTELSGPNLRL